MERTTKPLIKAELKREHMKRAKKRLARAELKRATKPLK